MPILKLVDTNANVENSSISIKGKKSNWTIPKKK